MTDVTRRTYEAFSRLPDTRSHRATAQLVEAYTPLEVVLSITPATILFALHRAREAQALAVSYRDFKVGAAIVALSQGRPGRFQILTGINIKPDETSELNGHAEQMALQTAVDHGFSAVSVVAVVGETQNDQQSGHEMATLHPCGKCRSVLEDHPLITPHSLIVSALPSFRTIEIATVEGLKAYHADEPNRDMSMVTRFDLPDMEILKPFVPPSDGQPVRLSESDTNAMRREEDIWNTTIGAYSLEHRVRSMGQL